MASMTLASSLTRGFACSQQQLRRVQHQCSVPPAPIHKSDHHCSADDASNLYPACNAGTSQPAQQQQSQQQHQHQHQPQNQQQQRQHQHQPHTTDVSLIGSQGTTPAAASCRHKSLKKWLNKDQALRTAVLLIAGAKLVRKAKQLATSWWHHRQATEAEHHKIALLWLRNDLRLHDHPALTAALQQCETVLPVYCFDPREYAVQPCTSNGHGTRETSCTAVAPRSTAQRAAFVLDSLHDLRARLRSIGSDLLVRQGAPEYVLPMLAQRLGAQHVYCHGEVTHEDVQVEHAVQAALTAAGGLAQLHTLADGCMLFNMDDLPNRVDTSAPPDYRSFCAHVTTAMVPTPLDAPSSLGPWPMAARLRTGTIPTLAQLGYHSRSQHTSSQHSSARQHTSSQHISRQNQTLLHAGHMQGGETEALRQVHTFIGQHRHVLQKQHLGQQKHQLQPAQPPAAAPIADIQAGKSVQHAIADKEAGGDVQQAISIRSWGSPTGAAAAAALSCRIGPWLAVGCLSPRQLYHTIASATSRELHTLVHSQAETDSKHCSHNTSMLLSQAPQAGPHQWLVCELLWRDFFRLITRKYSQGAGQVPAAAAT